MASSVSCVQIKRKSPAKSETRAETDTNSTPKAIDPNDYQFEWKLEDTGKPYWYRFTLKWDQAAVDNNFHFFINGEESDLKAIASPLSFKLPSGRDAVIEIKTQDVANKWSVVWHQTITTPEDLTITDLLKLDKAKTIKVHRLFFTEKGKILTMGHPLKIEVQHLYSQGGTIETFPEGTKAKTGDGLTPSPITVEAVDATGELFFQLRGEHGADGRNGEPWTTKQIDAVAVANGKVSCFQFPNGIQKPRTLCFCERQPQKGNDGPKGEPGRSGHDGGKGGDSGLLNIVLQNPPQDFRTIVNAQEGKGGAKGLGGPGQEGGAPSPAGQIEIPKGGYNRCPVFPGGVALGAGDKGKDGADGLNGAKTNYCMTISSEQHCYSL